MKTKIILLIACSAITCVRCEDFERPETGTEPAQIKSVSDADSQQTPSKNSIVEPAKDQITFQVQPTPKPERYMVYFSWPTIGANKKMRIRQAQHLALVGPELNTFSHEVDHNQTLNYIFEILDEDSKIEKSYNSLVKIPRDFVVKPGQNAFSENGSLTVKRLFINSDTPLITNGFNIEINTEILIANKGLIETFPEGSRTFTDNNGRSGGNLIIRAQVASGELKINVRGEAGGNGSTGPTYTSRAADGPPPGKGEMECTCGRNCITRGHCSCTSQGANGSNGSPGAKGYQGTNGGRGGDSGTLKVEIEDGSAFYLETQAIPGLGGSGGAGGLGQLGGLAGVLADPNKCSGQPGTNGPQGPQGDPGLPGQTGTVGTVCINITSEHKNDCF